MSHEVETMAYHKVETPWHHLGTPVDGDLTPEQMCSAAGLDWSVEMRPVYTQGLVRDEDGVYAPTLTPVAGKRAVTRTSDGRVFGMASDRWKPVQNRDALRFFDKFTKAGHATMETAGSLHGGKMVWGLAKLGADFKLPGDDLVKGYLLLVSPHEPGSALVARVTPIRVVCQNTLSLAMSKDAKFESRFSHVREFDPALAAETLGQAREQIRSFERNAHILKKLNLGTDDVIRVLAPIFQPVKAEKDVPVEALVADKTKLNKPMLSLMDALVNAPGADPETGWGTLASVTYHLDHSYGKSRDQRMFHSMLAKGAQQKRDVLTSLLALCNVDAVDTGMGLEVAA